MQRKGPGWHCDRGDFSFTKLAQDMILGAIEHTPVAPLAEATPRERRHWGFCPRCGQRFLRAEHGGGICPSCSLLLRGGIFYMLNEYCHHKHQSFYIGDPARQK
jgi:hypothetical protein